MNASRHSLWRITEAGALVAGTALVLFFAGYQAMAEYGRYAGVAMFESVSAGTTPWSPTRARAFSDGRPVGVLRIAGHRGIPIYAGATEANLDRGVAWIEGTHTLSLDGGNAGIAGHRDGFFRALKDVRIGDLLEVTTTRGQRTYAVSDLAVIEPSDVSALEPTYSTALTLVTCYPFNFVGAAPLRYIVRADAVGQRAAHAQFTGG